MLIFAFIGILYEIFFFYFLFTDVSIIGETFGYIDARYNWFRMAYVLFVLIVAVFTGLLFARESFKSKNPEIRLKGKLIAAAVISFLIGAALDGLFVINVVSLIVYKLVLISSAIEFYFGFFLPDWMKKRIHG